MSSTIAVYHSHVDPVIQEIENVYIIGRRVVKDYSHEFEFILTTNAHGEYYVDQNNKGSRVLVVHQEHNPNWVQLDFDLGIVYELDEMLRNITLKLNTMAFIGFNQTTSGDFRFALFENGKLLRSIYQKYLEFHNQMRLIDNYGKKLNFETIYLDTPFTRELPKDQRLDFDTLNDWQKQLGYVYQERRDLEYLHL